MTPQFLGIGAMVATGILWSFTGMVLGTAAKRQRDAISLMAMSSTIAIGLAVSVLLSLAGLTDLVVLDGPLPDRWWTMAGLIFTSGILVAFGGWALLRAMALGSQASAWTMAQSALIWPFLAGILLWGEPHRWYRSLGVGLVLAGLVCFGLARERREDGSRHRGSGLGFVLALCTFLVWGVQQVLMTLPSSWRPEFEDPTRSRPLIFYLGYCLTCWVIVLVRRRRPEPGAWRLAIPLATIGIVSQGFFFGLDRLGLVGRSSLGFPLAVGVCIAGFAIISMTVMKEKPHPFRLAGIAATLAGVAALAC